MATYVLTEMEDLRLYLQERVREFDPTVDTAIGSSFDTMVIQPLLTRLGPDPYNTGIRDFLLARVRNEFPDLVLQDGEPLDDYLIKPLQILLEPFRRQIQQVSNNQSLAYPDALNEREADALGANFFEARRLGGYAVGSARLYWSAPQYAQINPTNVVRTGSGLIFIPIESQAITADNMLFNLEDNLYYFDVIVRAEKQGAAYNIDPNTLTGIDGVSSVVKVTNKRKFDEGADKETTTEFLARVEKSLAEKSLVTVRGIRSRLLEVFDSIRLIQVIGYGDPEMQRDILTGESNPKSYATAVVTSPSVGNRVELSSPTNSIVMHDGSGFMSSLLSAGVTVGDTLFQLSFATGQVTQHTVQEVGADYVLVTPNVTSPLPSPAASFSKPGGKITISGLPGGMTDPNTPVEINDNEVHIGGMTDVFVRAGDPSQRDTTITGVLDGKPLRFGVDLESFGEEDERLVQLHSTLSSRFYIPSKDRYGATLTDPDSAHILVHQCDTVGTNAGRHPWKATEDDVGRFIQLLGGASNNWGTFEITEYLGEEYIDDVVSGTIKRAVRLVISTTDKESGTQVTMVPTSPIGFTEHGRFVESVAIKDMVRDRDGSVVAIPGAGGNDPTMGGVNFSTILPSGAKIGDSVVLETGADAGIYSIRRILTWLSPNDTIVLDRELTASLHPSGVGDGTGLRYRVADELNVDLVAPKITKIPIGDIFTGMDLNTVAGSENISVSGDTNFLLAGVVADDTLEIASGDNAGIYKIKSVTSTTAVLDRPVASTSFAVEFYVYRAFTGVDRPLVRVKEIEILDSNSQPTGIKIPYGKEVDVRVSGTLGNRVQGAIVESTTGQTADDGFGHLLRFEDPDVDFSDPDVDLAPGYRLNILNSDSAGSYVIAEVHAAYLLVEPVANGGKEFANVSIGIHYTIGLPSSGYARLYFTNPTSVEIQTGLAGARLFTDDATPKEFLVSKVDGYALVPAAGSDETPRDLRVARNYEDPLNPGQFFSVVELTDDTRPGVFELELQEGDVLAVNEPIPFRGVRQVRTGTLTWHGPGLTVDGATANPDIMVGCFLCVDSAPTQWYEVVSIAGNVFTVSNDHGYTVPSGSLASSYSATFAQMGIYGTPAGLRTVIGSNVVSVPNGSLIDFSAMDLISGLVGQKLFIDSGADAGEYTVEAILSSKSLRLDKVMTSTTASILSMNGLYPEFSTDAVRDSYLEPSGSKTNMIDSEVTPSTVPNHYITLFEGIRKELKGSFEISRVLNLNTVELDLDSTSDIVNPNGKRTLTGDQTDGATSAGGVFVDSNATFSADGVQVGDTLVCTSVITGRFVIATVGVTQLTVVGGLTPSQSGIAYRVEASRSDDPFLWGPFGWVRTSTNENVEQAFRTYRAVATETEIVEVSPKRGDISIGPRQGRVVSGTWMKAEDGADFSALGVTRGDVLEILAGLDAGVYPILAVGVDGGVSYVEIQGASFPNILSGVPYRIWAGIRGSANMLRVGTYAVYDGLLEPGTLLPYKIVRPAVYRLSSTEMDAQFDGTLYYADVQIESLGSGDEFNLKENTRLVFSSGISVDGYQYQVAADKKVLTFSPYEEVSLVFDRRFLPVGNSDSPENLTEVSGRNIKITYDTSVVANLVNNMLRSYFDRPMNANPLGRHFLPSYVLVNLRYEGGISADEVGIEIEDYINQLGSSDVLEVSDLEAFLTRRGATSIRHPIELVTITHDLERKLVANRSGDVLGGTNAVPYNGTGRISAFFATLGEGLTVTKS